MVRPILFNGEMVRAILEGRKTVTRRIIKQDKINAVVNSPVRKENPKIPDSNFINCLVDAPYQRGDILYVRETWNGDWCDHYIYRADGGSAKTAGYNQEPKWRPSIHMPKKAARIWMKVTDVRAERLHNLTNRDAKKEGITVETDNSGMAHKAAFMRLWDSTIKKSDISRYGWNANPWVWVIEFERCEKPEPCILRGVEPAEEKRPCIGYGDAWADEPCEMCKGCSQCTGNDEEAER